MDIVIILARLALKLIDIFDSIEGEVKCG